MVARRFSGAANLKVLPEGARLGSRAVKMGLRPNTKDYGRALGLSKGLYIDFYEQEMKCPRVLIAAECNAIGP